MSNLIFGLMICVAHSTNDPCTFTVPEYGHGHVAYSRTLDARELMREALTECEVAHSAECSVYCFLSRGENE